MNITTDEEDVENAEGELEKQQLRGHKRDLTLVVGSSKIVELEDENCVSKKVLEIEDEEAASDFIHKEGGWGWIVVIATGYCFGTLMGMINNYALIYNEFDNVYNGTDNHIFYAGMLYICVRHDRHFLYAIKSLLFFSKKNSSIHYLGGIFCKVWK
jgi:hypothetical protein